MSSGERWRRTALWTLPALLVAANLGWLVLFGSGSRLRAADLERRGARVAREHAAASARLAARESLWVVAHENRERSARLFAERFATERARFTDQVRELKALAERADLVPAAIAYPTETLDAYGLVRRSFVFSVEGSYGALRTFLHLLELSPSFVIVEQIGVGESGRGLAVRLRLSTLFATAEEEAP
jgi:hypothetical protein